MTTLQNQPAYAKAAQARKPHERRRPLPKRSRFFAFWRLRFADLPLVIKIGVAPVFALIMLVLAAATVLWSQQHQLAVLNTVLHTSDMRSRLEKDSQAITAANGMLYEIMTKQAHGGSAADSQENLKIVLADIDHVRVDLRGLVILVPISQRKSLVMTLHDLDNYRGAVQVLGAMLGVDFNAAADFIKPYEANYTRITIPLETLSGEAAHRSAQVARASRRQARLIAETTIATVGATLLIVLVVVTVVIVAVRRTVAEISNATQRLAAGRVDVDLRPLQRHDELGAIVRSLGVFEENQRRIAVLRAERSLMEKQQREVRALAERDELTGLLNRRAMLPLIEREMSLRAQPQVVLPPVCLAMLDIDHFKAVNDDYGHLAGDEVLRIVTRVCLSALRTGDVLARWGGEEFLLMLPETDLELSRHCLQRLRELLAVAVFDSIDPGLRVTVSMGVAQIDPSDTLETVLDRADKALYEAKHTGRNKICVADGA